MAKDRATAGFASATVVAAVSLGALILAWQMAWPVARGPALIVHGTAGLCMLWSVLAFVLQPGGRRGQPDRPGAMPGPPDPIGETPAPPTCMGGTPVPQVLLGASLTLGLPAFILMLFQAVFETVSRTVSFSFKSTLRAHIWPSGWLDLAAVAVALIIARVLTRDRRTITALFWLAAFAGLWQALQAPAFESWLEGGVERDVATHWSSPLMGWLAMVVAAFTAAAGIAEHRRRVRAWPDELWKLAAPLPAWPGFRYSAGATAVVVLILGCVHVVLPLTPVSAFIAGASMLALAHRRWEENLADVGLALITLGVVAILAVWRPETASKSEFFVEVSNRALIGLAIMTAFWHWLADVWVQQLDGGRAWTTAGRLIHTTRRVAYLVAAAGVLIATHMAMWPMLPYSTADDSAWRWAWGMGGNMLLISALIFSTLRTGKPTLAWLTVLGMAAAVGYVMTRTQASVFMQQWARHWPVELAATASGLLVLAAAAHRSRLWGPFWEPLFLTGLLILPVTAIAGVSLFEQLHLARWVPPATFGSLAAVYVLAAWLPGPRSFLIVGGICGAVSVYMMV